MKYIVVITLSIAVLNVIAASPQRSTINDGTSISRPSRLENNDRNGLGERTQNGFGQQSIGSGFNDQRMQNDRRTQGSFDRPGSVDRLGQDQRRQSEFGRGQTRLSDSGTNQNGRYHSGLERPDGLIDQSEHGRKHQLRRNFV